MPELDFAILADRVSAEPGGVGYVMRGGIDTIGAPAVPSVQHVGLLFRVSFTHAECDRPHRFEVIFQGADGERLMQATGVLHPKWITDLPAHWRVNQLGGLNFPIPLPAFGIYSFEILVNDSNEKTIQLRVIPATPQSEPASG